MSAAWSPRQAHGAGHPVRPPLHPRAHRHLRDSVCQAGEAGPGGPAGTPAAGSGGGWVGRGRRGQKRVAGRPRQGQGTSTWRMLGEGAPGRRGPLPALSREAPPHLPGLGAVSMQMTPSPTPGIGGHPSAPQPPSHRLHTPPPTLGGPHVAHTVRNALFQGRGWGRWSREAWGLLWSLYPPNP